MAWLRLESLTGTIGWMEGTSGTPHLLTDVRFSVAKKGYDPDEVDNFLERVSAAVAQLQDKLRQATAQAEVAEARAGEAGRSQAALQSRIEALEAELAQARESQAAAPPRSPEDEAEQVSKVLVLAQRTADAAIEEANASARTTLADARSQASTIVGDAQSEADRIMAQARVDAEQLVSSRRQTLADEIRGLEQVRDAVSSDVSVLERHAGDQRGVLQAAVSRLQAVLDDPAAFRVAPAPATSGAALSDVIEEPAAAEPPVEQTAGEEPAGEEPAPADEAEPVAAGHDEQPSTEDAAEPGAETSEPAEAPPAHTGPSTDQVPPVAAVFEEPDPSAPPVRPAASLFSTGVHQPVADDDESPLGPPDEQADAAMRAFFEAEFDDERRGPH